jgi:CRISPR-associated protein Cas5d
MKVERVSYDVITPSAARGIIEAIYWKPAIRWKIDKIHVLSEIRFTNVRRNEVSEKASVSNALQAMQGSGKSLCISAIDNRQQRASMVLKDVDYVIEVHFERVAKTWGERDTEEGHYNIALRRIRQGQYFHTPCLGTREFPASVEIVESRRDIPKGALVGTRNLGWMLYDMDFSNPQDIRPIFFKASMRDGVIDLTQAEVRQ